MKFDYATTIKNKEIKTSVSITGTKYRLDFTTSKFDFNGKVCTAVSSYEQNGGTESFVVFGNLNRILGHRTKYPRVTKKVLLDHHNSNVDRELIEIFVDKMLRCIADGYSPSESYQQWVDSKKTPKQTGESS